jgi:hypothetical protein
VLCRVSDVSSRRVSSLPFPRRSPLALGLGVGGHATGSAGVGRPAAHLLPAARLPLPAVAVRPTVQWLHGSRSPSPSRWTSVPGGECSLTHTSATAAQGVGIAFSTKKYGTHPSYRARLRFRVDRPFRLSLALVRCVRPLYSDAKVANRGIRVWHGATENGP